MPRESRFSRITEPHGESFPDCAQGASCGLTVTARTTHSHAIALSSGSMFRAFSVVVRVILAAAVIAVCPTFARAGPCDVTWDGEALAHSAQGRSPALETRLLDNNKNVVAELTGAQILAITEAKAAIAKELGRSPSLLFCSDKAPNAFAVKTPNGEVVGVTIGLATLIDGDRDMAAFVIGHEYGHLVLGHQAAAEQRRALLTLLGDVAGAFLEYKAEAKTHVEGLGMNVGVISASLISMKFDRDQERQADEAGFRYMVDAGFNPLGAVRLAEIMQREGAGGIGLFFDNHPGWPERTARFQALIKASPAAQAAIARTGTRTALTTVAHGGGTQVALVPVYETTEAQKTLADGIAALSRNDFQAGVTAIRSSAAAGYAPAQAMLGYLYSEGRAGLPKDDVEAVRLLRLAAAQSNGYAMNNLGAMYMRGRGGLSVDEGEAVRLYQEAASQGNAVALKNLGDVYLKGLAKAGIEKDEMAARKYLQQAADAGNGDALALVGAFYQDGSGGLEKNIPKATALYRQAADKGSAVGRYCLARCYELGTCEMQKDEAEAVRWLQLAADQGNLGAENDLGLMYTRGAGSLPKDDVKAAHLYKIAADGGYAPAQTNLGSMYIAGQGGLIESSTEALRLFQLAAAQGQPSAEFNIGLMYELGKGVPKDRDTAVSWYRKAAAHGLPNAVKKLSDLHAN
jgi:TPR repeat protein/Zn-dependent protease with chaperone function